MTPCCQDTDTDSAFLVKRAARNEEQVVRQELKQSVVEEPPKPVATEPAAVEEPPKAVATEPLEPEPVEEPPEPEAVECAQEKLQLDLQAKWFSGFWSDMHKEA